MNMKYFILPLTLSLPLSAFAGVWSELNKATAIYQDAKAEQAPTEDPLDSLPLQAREFADFEGQSCTQLKVEQKKTESAKAEYTTKLAELNTQANSTAQKGKKLFGMAANIMGDRLKGEKATAVQNLKDMAGADISVKIEAYTAAQKAVTDDGVTISTVLADMKCK